jgi:dihydrofolate reductase
VPALRAGAQQLCRIGDRRLEVMPPRRGQVLRVRSMPGEPQVQRRPMSAWSREDAGVAKLVFGMNQSLDGYVDHMKFGPSPTLFRHFIGEAETQTGSIYGRVMYDIMRYWDDDDPGWGADELAYAAAWRRMPKWVVSRTLQTVGPNATLVDGDLDRAIRTLKADHDGEIEVAGPNLARSLTELGLIDEYRIYLHPAVLGTGTPFFAAPPPSLRLIAHDRIDDDVIRLTYVAADRP